VKSTVGDWDLAVVVGKGGISWTLDRESRGNVLPLTHINGPGAGWSLA
jgi:hypothetical protein